MSENNEEGLLVIGAGCMRTGTHSLKKALEILLGCTCYHMEEIVKHRRGDFKLWVEAAEKDELSEDIAKKIFRNYNCTADFPAAHFYDDLMKIYPNAKVLLTVRDADKWATSCLNTVFNQDVSIVYMGFFGRLIAKLNGVDKLRDLMQLIVQKKLGISNDIYHLQHQELVAAFKRYNEKVKRVVPSDRLLVFEVSQGWEPLCEFLCVPVPDVPFPKVNDTAHFQSTVSSVKKAHTVLGILLNCLIAAGVLWIAYKLT